MSHKGDSGRNTEITKKDTEQVMQDTSMTGNEHLQMIKLVFRLGVLPGLYQTNYKIIIRTYHAPTIKPMRNPTLQALLFNTAKIPRKRTKLTSERSMYAAGNVNPHPNPLRILPTITGVKLN